MRYELDLIYQLCHEIGLLARMVADQRVGANQRVEVDLGQGAVLCFQNSEHEADCLIGFLHDRIAEGEEFHQDNRNAEGYEFPGIDWHAHGNLTFADARGYCVKLDYLDLVVGLQEGRVLICEREVEGRTYRWLIHSEYTGFRDIQAGERIIVRRAVTHPAETSRT